MEYLEFIFQSFWHFIGVVILIYAIGEVVTNVANNGFRTIIKVLKKPPTK